MVVSRLVGPRVAGQGPGTSLDIALREVGRVFLFLEAQARVHAGRCLRSSSWPGLTSEALFIPFSPASCVSEREVCPRDDRHLLRLGGPCELPPLCSRSGPLSCRVSRMGLSSHQWASSRFCLDPPCAPSNPLPAPTHSYLGAPEQGSPELGFLTHSRDL